jgi:hypothetical protein
MAVFAHGRSDAGRDGNPVGPPVGPKPRGYLPVYTRSLLRPEYVLLDSPLSTLANV